MDAMISASKAALVAVQPGAFCIDDDVAPAHSAFGHVSDLILVGLDVQEESGSSLDAPNPAWACQSKVGLRARASSPSYQRPGLRTILRKPADLQSLTNRFSTPLRRSCLSW